MNNEYTHTFTPVVEVPDTRSDFVLGELAQIIFLNELKKESLSKVICEGDFDNIPVIGEVIAKTSFILAREFLEERARQYEASSIKATGININDIKFGGDK